MHIHTHFMHLFGTNKKRVKKKKRFNTVIRTGIYSMILLMMALKSGPLCVTVRYYELFEKKKYKC